MALETKRASRARNDVTIGVILIVAVTVLVGAAYLLLTGTSSNQASVQTGTYVMSAEEQLAQQKALADFRLSEKGIPTAAEQQAAEQKALADFRLSEKGPTTAEEARVAELKALAEFRLSEKSP